MGELLRRGRDEEEAQWAVAVARGTTVERARGLAPEAARRAAIKNLSANIHHYDAASAATDKADALPASPARPSHFPPGIRYRMISTDDTRIHGITTRYADDGVEVSYVYPGSLEVRLATGVTMPAATRPQQVVLGMLLADPDQQDCTRGSQLALAGGDAAGDAALGAARPRSRHPPREPRV
jgi:hypothetical protein